ncbi:MAG: YicC family protein [Bacteroidales bacterium]|nr:YicC family protein [Bacteroidales bacterium]
MILSMTGYGKAICELPNKKITVEIKSLNSKQLDLSTRIPTLYREKELEIRSDIASKLFRGKVDFMMFSESQAGEKSVKINTDIIESYFGQMKELADKFGQTDRTDFLRIIMPLPDTVTVEQPELDEEEWLKVKATIGQAIDNLVAFRTQEGKALDKDLRTRINLISGFLSEVPQYEACRIEKIRNRIQTNLDELVGKNNIDENRLEQELIFYIEKLDINEEKVRLANHLKYFTETMDNENEPGKKLGFIAQEIGREINTLGSKANEANMQKLVIKMKDELEKIKEQVLNVL